MNTQLLIATLFGMAIESIIDGIVNNGKPRSTSGSVIKVGLYLSWAIVIFVLSNYW